MKKKRSIKILFILRFVFLTALVLIAAPGCVKDYSVVNITLIQLNDVYEISPVCGGKQGGLARVATLRKELIEQNPNTYTILAGDLFSPSALGTAPYEDKRLDGRQIVDVMNYMGLDYATFGNHEFDLKKEAFYERLQESKFTWFSSNVFAAKSESETEPKPFPGVVDTVVFNAIKDKNTLARIGLIGVTLRSNPKPYVFYKDPIETMKAKAAELKDKVDILIAVTHLAIEDDIRLASEVPELDMILGGHEHENIEVLRGADFTPVCKADANARTAYIHNLRYDTSTGELEINSQLKFITDEIADDNEVGAVVKMWTNMGYDGFRENGFEPDNIVARITVPLDGRESTVRNKPTGLTDLVAKAMLNATEGTELSIFNGGSVRIDDILPPGNITEYDVIRIAPFGGDILTVKMENGLLKEVLDQGLKNRGTGGYLQTCNVVKSGTEWQINGKPLDSKNHYKVAITDFLLTGNETGLEYLTPDNKKLKIIKTKENMDILKAIILQLEKTYGRAKNDQNK